MDNFKISYIKYDDKDSIVENLKSIMATYDMELIECDNGKYVFDRDGSYSRSFMISEGENGWITLYDEDDAQAESLSMEMSGVQGCFIVCIGTHKDLLYYTVFENGEQVGQYLSTFDYYEYPVDGDVIDKYRGDAKVFGPVIAPEDMEKLQNILDRCRDGSIEAVEGLILIQGILGITTQEVVETGQESVEDDEVDEFIDVDDIFYVDFESMNVKAHSREDVIDAVVKIAEDMGYKRVDNFDRDDNEKRGFFKKIISAVSESRRIQFYISPLSGGWVTIVGELQTLYGDSPAQWEFLNVEEQLSIILKQEVINVYGDSEGWGFKVFKHGDILCKYSSDGEDYGDIKDCDIMSVIDVEKLDNLINRPMASVEDIDSAIGEFCSLMGIVNYKINIPMDYSEEEFNSNVLCRLPDGKNFINLKFKEFK